MKANLFFYFLSDTFGQNIKTDLFIITLKHKLKTKYKV